MNFLKNLSARTKLIVACSLTVVMTLIIAAVGTGIYSGILSANNTPKFSPKLRRSAN